MIHVVGETLAPSKLLADLACGEVAGLDTETEGIDPKSEAPACGKGRIACWSISTPRFPKVFLWADELEYFRPWLEDPDSPKVGHNIYGFDYHMFANHGIELRGVVGDTKAMSRLLYCSKMRSHGLKDLARNWLNIEQPSFNSLFKRPKHEVYWHQESKTSKGEKQNLEFRHTRLKVGAHRGVPTLTYSGERGRFGKALEYIPLSSIPELYPNRLEALYEYASTDAYLTRLLYERFREELQKVSWQVEK